MREPRVFRYGLTPAPVLLYLLRRYAVRTVLTRISTFRDLRTAPKMVARLFMLGLPADDSMRCRLLLGFFVLRASVSKPTVALTRSRRIRRAVSGSPLRNSVAASSSMALAKAGSRCTRSTTVCLKSRLSAISSPSAFAALRIGLCAFAGFVVGEQFRPARPDDRTRPDTDSIRPGAGILRSGS